MKTQVQITKASLKKSRPSTVFFEGFIGRTSFYGELQGVNLVITSGPDLDEKQFYTFEEKVQDEYFPVPYDGIFKRTEINKIMKEAPLIFTI